jgi:hypothetical protein
MIVLGADTHKRSHTIAAVAAATGELLGEQTVQVGAKSFAALVLWARGLGSERVWAIEDCRHVSGSFERFLIERGERVVRVTTKLMADARRRARGRGKSDIAIGTGTDVAVETADVVLMRSDPLDVATAITISRGTNRKMHQNLAWAVGYNSLALPIAAGVFEPLGFVLRPEVGAISMAGSSIIVALNAVALKRLRLPERRGDSSHSSES